jgi:glycosyltransferase involved in cell wall biosynthesis
VRLLVIGDGPLRQALETEAKSLSIIRQVQFLGYRDDIPELLNVADIVILSTNWEGLPLVPLEAAACKKPVIASDVIGVQETVVNGETGYLFKKGDAHDLAEKIKNLLENPELRRKMGENGYRFVIQNFSLENMVLRYDALYEKIMSRHEDTRD